MVAALVRSLMDSVFGNDAARANAAAELADAQARDLQVERLVARLRPLAGGRRRAA